MSIDETTQEGPLFSSSDYNDEELVRLVELQRRQTELLNPGIDNVDLYYTEDDDFSVTGGSVARDAKKNSLPVPDMRFEKQFDNSVQRLQEENASTFRIIWSTIIKDQILIPFVSGFGLSLCSSAWKWYRTKGVINAKNPKNFGLFHNIHNSIAEWTKHVFNAIARNVPHLSHSAPPALKAD